MISNKLENIFRAARKKWGGNGSGSTFEKTHTLAIELAKLIRDYQIRSMLDYGCGTVDWILPVVAKTRIPYVGVDVVSEVIKENEALGAPRVRFLHLNQDTVLPIVHLVFIRDTLAHLSNATIVAELTRLKRTGAEWLLVSNYAGSKNTAIQDGGFRKLNLCAVPFGFPEPRQVIAEGGTEGKTMALWRFDEIMKDVEKPTLITISPDGGAIRVEDAPVVHLERAGQLTEGLYKTWTPPPDEDLAPLPGQAVLALDNPTEAPPSEDGEPELGW